METKETLIASSLAELATLPSFMSEPINFNTWVSTAQRYVSDRPFNDPEKASVTRKELRPIAQDDEVAQCVARRAEAVNALEYLFEARDGAAELPEELLSDLERLAEFRSELTDIALNEELFGYCVYDVIYDQPSGPNTPISVSKVLELPFENYRLTKSGQLRMPNEVDQPKLEQALAEGKIKYSINRPSHHNPYGEALLVPIFVPWVIRQHVREQWAKATTRFGEPFLVGKLKQPNTKLDTGGGMVMLAKDLMLRGLDAATRGSSIVVGAEDEVTALEAKVDAELFRGILRDQTESIQRLILGQTLTSGTGEKGGGSYALGKVHSEVFAAKRDYTANAVEQRLNELIEDWWRLNENSDAPPVFKFVYPEAPTKEQADRDATLQPVLKAAGLQFSPLYFKEKYGLTDEYLQPATAPAPEPAPALSAQALLSLGALLGYSGRKGGAVEAGDLLTEQAVKTAPQPLSAEMLMDVVKGAKDPAELQARLARVFEAPEHTVEFARALRDVQVTAAVMGMIAANKRIN